MGISIVNNGGTNSITINNSNDIVIKKNEGQQNINVNASKNVEIDAKDSMMGYHIIMAIFFSAVFIAAGIFFYKLVNSTYSCAEDLIIKEDEEENLFEKRKKELLFLIKEKFHSDQVINRIMANILTLESKYSKNLMILNSIEFKKDYLEQTKKENEEIIFLLENFINKISISKSNFEEREDLEKILSIFKN